MDESAQISRRAKIRIGIAAALLVTAIGILFILDRRTTEHLPASAEQPPTSSSVAGGEAEPSLASGPAVDTAAVPSAPAPPSDQTAEDLGPTGIPPELGQEAPATQENVSVIEESKGQSASVTPSANTQPSLRPASKARMYEVQLGAFSDPENAKQLQARLTHLGIPSHTETRVQIGPLKSREEAERTKEKLIALKMKSVIIAR